jgi:transcription antitermination factor NusG
MLILIDTPRRAVDIKDVHMRREHRLSEDPAPDGGISHEEVAFTMKWYILYTRHHHEQSVCKRLEQKGFEAYMPLMPSWRQSKRGTRQVSIPLFPRYIFVRCYLEMYAHLELITMPGVLRLVEDSQQQLLVMPEEEIRLLQKLGGSGMPLEQAAYPLTGKRVEVMEGPLQGITGIVRQGSPTAVFVAVPTLQASVRVEFGRTPKVPYKTMKEIP